VLLLAAVFGVLSALLMFAFLNSKGGDDGVQEALDSGAGAETVVVLTKNVNVGDKITSDMLGTKTIPAAGIVEGYFKDSDMSTLVGKVATAPMYSGEQVLAAKVTTYEGQDTATWKVPEGMRGLSLQVPHEAWIAAGLPQPGDRVDVLGITTLMKVDPLTGEEKPDVIAGFVAQDVLVLAIAQSVVRTIPKIDADAKTSGDGSSSGTGIEQSQAVSPEQEATTYEKSMSVTLALPPDLAAKVALLDAMEDDTGQYRLLVRQKGDTAPVQGKQIYSYEDVFPAR
jgi:Flp pilus assembly protein CpaB